MERVRLNLVVEQAVADRIEKIRAATEYPSATETIRRALIFFEKQVDAEAAANAGA